MSDNPTIKNLDAVVGFLRALYNAEILAEYEDVLHRPKFSFDIADVRCLIDSISELGVSVIMSDTISTDAIPDPDDVIFYEAAMSREDSYLITGNIKHFPKTARIVTPNEMLDILSIRL